MKEQTFNVVNFGCRATQADGAAIEQAFKQHDLQRSASWHDASVVVVNTCTVTNNADLEARQVIRRIHRENPGAKIVVTGCYAQRCPEELAGMAGVTCVIGNSHKEQLVPIVVNNHLSRPQSQRQREGVGSADVYCGSIFEVGELRSIADPSGGGRTRPVLKIQDGCSYRCSYCVIPAVRGDSRSLAPAEVLRQVRLLLAQGFREITLTGIHLGGYGRDHARSRGLAQVMQTLLTEDRLARLRLSSIEPLEYTDELVELVASSPNMAKHFHVPLQSGSDRILRLMRRPYTADFYLRLVEKMRRLVPDAAIGADVMVGFPSETYDDHSETLSLLEAAPITYLHVFPYSPRPGTSAADLTPQVHGEVTRRRSSEVRELATRKNLNFRESFVGRTLSAITLDRGDHGSTEALSSNYLTVLVANVSLPANQMIDVEITGIVEGALTGCMSTRMTQNP